MICARLSVRCPLLHIIDARKASIAANALPARRTAVPNHRRGPSLGPRRGGRAVSACLRSAAHPPRASLRSGARGAHLGRRSAAASVHGRLRSDAATSTAALPAGRRSRRRQNDHGRAPDEGIDRARRRQRGTAKLSADGAFRTPAASARHWHLDHRRFFFRVRNTKEFASRRRNRRAYGALRFNIDLLAERLVDATAWLTQDSDTRYLSIGYFGASTGAAAALVAAAERPEAVRAVVSRGGRPDLAGPALMRVLAPALLIVGGNDVQVIQLNREALAQLRCEKQLVIVPRATHLFEEPGALDGVARLAREWFHRHLIPVVRHATGASR
jgi:hypothetical protein